MRPRTVTKITDICDIQNYVMGWQDVGDTWELTTDAVVPDYDSGTMKYWKIKHNPTGVYDTLTLKLTIKC